jgi:hypothetical protein
MLISFPIRQLEILERLETLLNNIYVIVDVHFARIGRIQLFFLIVVDP